MEGQLAVLKLALQGPQHCETYVCFFMAIIRRMLDLSTYVSESLHHAEALQTQPGWLHRLRKLADTMTQLAGL